MELRHLSRDVKSAVELAIVGLAPAELVDRLAVAAGLLEAVVELPVDSPPVATLVPKVLSRARSALDEWTKWQAEHLAKAPA
jgi:hypothetical protein